MLEYNEYNKMHLFGLKFLHYVLKLLVGNG